MICAVADGQGLIPRLLARRTFHVGHDNAHLIAVVDDGILEDALHWTVRLIFDVDHDRSLVWVVAEDASLRNDCPVLFFDRDGSALLLVWGIVRLLLAGPHSDRTRLPGGSIHNLIDAACNPNIFNTFEKAHQLFTTSHIHVCSPSLLPLTGRRTARALTAHLLFIPILLRFLRRKFVQHRQGRGMAGTRRLELPISLLHDGLQALRLVFTDD